MSGVPRVASASCARSGPALAAIDQALLRRSCRFDYDYSSAIGLLEDAFEVTADPPPVIYALEPPSVINQDQQQITVVGASFRSPTFSAECRQPNGDVVDLAGTVISNDDTTIDVEPTPTPPHRTGSSQCSPPRTGSRRSPDRSLHQRCRTPPAACSC